MFERLLDKENIPTEKQLEEYSGDGKVHLLLLNEFLLEEMQTEKSIHFPYGNKYGWSIARRKKKKLICDLFPENGAFTLMIRLENKDIDKIYDDLHESAKDKVDHKYPCGEGGWIHFQILTDDDLEDAKRMLLKKCPGSSHDFIHE